MCVVPPKTAVLRSMVALASASRPGWVRGTGPCEPPLNAPPKNWPKMSDMSPMPNPDAPPNPPALGSLGSTPESYMRRLSGSESTA